MFTHTRKNQGVCSRSTTVTLNDDGTINKIEVVGGCPGNIYGISSLVVGLDAKYVINRFEGTPCGPRKSSCPDQIAQALKEAIELQKQQ